MDNGQRTVLGRYEILTLLASGGMADIFLARQTGIRGFERIVVIKKIFPHLARQERFVEMFLDEARIAAQINHPNVVQIHDLGEENGEFFIAMEYLEGESLSFLLKHAIKKNIEIPQELAAGIVAQVCDGLEHAHTLHDNQGNPLHIVHRDVSPQNIFILYSGIAKLVDFGIAKAASQAHETHTGTLKGKLSYMSPEQCRSEPADARSDIFSLGVVLWELLTLKRLFKRSNEVDMIQAVLSGPIPPVRSVREDASPELAAIAERALQRDPALRFQSAAEMGTALRSTLRDIGKPVTVADVSAFTKKVFSGLQRTKQEVLAALHDRKDPQIPLQILRHDTGESLTGSPSFIRRDKNGELHTQTGSAIDIDVTLPSHRKTWAAVFLLGAALVIGGYLLFFRPGDDPDTGRDAGMPAQTGDDGRTRPDGGKETDGTAVATGPATLHVTSEPSSCRVQVDDKDADGLTPLSVTGLAPAVEHSVTVHCKGHLPQEQRVQAGAGQRLTLHFNPDPAPAEVPTGRLRLKTSPWTIVYLGKRKLGMTPLTGVRLPAGRHRLTAVNRDKGIRKSFVVVIRPGKTTILRKKLAP